ncbi:hypothetical protein BDP27DRAFT_1322215, partial [Rhodocollybia butyracea]
MHVQILSAVDSFLPHGFIYISLLPVLYPRTLLPWFFTFCRRQLKCMHSLSVHLMVPSTTSYLLPFLTSDKMPSFTSLP